MKENDTIKIIAIKEWVKIALMPSKTISIYVNGRLETSESLFGGSSLMRLCRRTYNKKKISNEKMVARLVGQNSYIITLKPKEELSNRNTPKIAIFRFLKILIKIL